MVLILDPKAYDEWLACPVADAPKFFAQWACELVAVPDPLLRAPRSSSGKVVAPPIPPALGEGELF